MKLVQITSSVLLPLVLAIYTGEDSGLRRAALDSIKSVSYKSSDHASESRIYEAGGLPLDPFILHHPYVQSNLAEFDYSDWYYLVLRPQESSLEPGPDNSSIAGDLARSAGNRVNTVTMINISGSWQIS